MYNTHKYIHVIGNNIIIPILPARKTSKNRCPNHVGYLWQKNPREHNTKRCVDGKTRDVSIINERGAPRPGVVCGGVVSGCDEGGKEGTRTAAADWQTLARLHDHLVGFII